ncbi:MAG TPA: cytochrome c [Pseudolabrys sp.]|jgi:mono/diheme cytochrome c family protein|nr:cytochrome c [Pseudolabrys sp.]
MLRIQIPLIVSRTAWLAVAATAFALGGTGFARSDEPAHSSPTSGHQVYMAARCFACHGEMGFGGVGPRFRQNRFVGMRDYVVGQILIGRGVMPSFAETLNNQQIAAVATYIRNSWGNDFGPVKASEVEHVRQEIKLKPPQGPHLPPESQQPPGAPVPPGSNSPGQALPPDQSK